MFRCRLIMFALVVGVLLPALPVSAQQDGTAARRLAGQFITQKRMRECLTFIASDALQGRDTPSPGLDAAAQFIAFNLSRWGLKPMGDDGTYFQRIALTRRRVETEKCSALLNGVPLRYGDDYLAGSGNGTASGPLVFVGHGYVVTAKGIDAYAGVDVRGKILVVTSGRLPQGISGDDLDRSKRGTEWLDAPLYAERNGAVGIVNLPYATDARGWDVTRNVVTRFGGRYTLAEQAASSPTPSSLPTITLSPDTAAHLLAGEKQTSAGPTFTFSPEKKLAFTVSSITDNTTTQNVVAVVEGGDPALKSEYVAFGAHYDHIGVGRPDENGDAINNGADDDGSGTTALLAMAESFARSTMKPRRSVLFVWHCGEEKGLWGSGYFVKHPTVPLAKIVTQLNIDMIGRAKLPGDTAEGDANLSGPNQIYVIGSRMMSSELGDLSEHVNRAYLNLAFDYRYDDPKDPERFFYRSDHYNYAKNGIPIIFYFDGVHVDYHRPGDQVEKIDFAKMEKVTRTVFLTAVEIANRPRRPMIDKPLATR